MPQQTPEVPEQSDRAEDARWDLPGRLRQDILSSWKRSLLAGLAPERFTVPYVTDVDEDGPLAWAAAPVMTRIAEDLEGAGIGILLAPKSLLAVRGLASAQRRWARQWSGVTIATPYRPRPVEITNGLIGRLQRCKWLLTDPATWRDLLWALVGVPVSVVLGLLPVFMLVAGVWVLVADLGATRLARVKYFSLLA